MELRRGRDESSARCHEPCRSSATPLDSRRVVCLITAMDRAHIQTVADTIRPNRLYTSPSFLFPMSGTSNTSTATR